jgi:ABC-type oligopeptide transport system substrate-binding subunit
MKRTSLFNASVLVIFSTILSACAGQSVLPTTTPFPATKTSTPSPIPATSTLTSTPTNTNTPEPTPIPGVQVYPISSLGNSIPWLPYDDAKKPMSVYYGFNVEKPPFDNVLVRQAFAAAIDREQIAQKALEYYFRNAEPATSLTPSEILSRDLYNEVGISFDPTRAKELLQQAGYSNVESFPSTTLLVSTRGKGAPGAYYQMAKLIVDMWQVNLGITVEIEVAEIQSYRDRFATNPPHIYQLGWVADYKDPDNFLKALFHSNSEVNFGHFNNKEFDGLVDEAARLTDPEKRLLLYIQAEQLLAEKEAGLIPLYHSYVPIPYAY